MRPGAQLYEINFQKQNHVKLSSHAQRKPMIYVIIPLSSTEQINYVEYIKTVNDKYNKYLTLKTLCDANWQLTMSINN